MDKLQFLVLIMEINTGNHLSLSDQKDANLCLKCTRLALGPAGLQKPKSGGRIERSLFAESYRTKHNNAAESHAS